MAGAEGSARRGQRSKIKERERMISAVSGVGGARVDGSFARMPIPTVTLESRVEGSDDVSPSLRMMFVF